MKEPQIRFSLNKSSYERKYLNDIAKINPKSTLPESFEYVDLESVVGTEMKKHRKENKTTAPSRAQRVAQKGDIFYQTVRPYQKNNLHFDLESKDFVFSSGYAQIRSEINSEYLFTLLQQDDFLKQVMENCTGTSYPAINPSNLSKLVVTITTDIEEQQDIADFFKTFDLYIKCFSDKVTSLKQIKLACLQSMFPQEGKSVPKLRFKGFDMEWERRNLSEIATFRKGKGYSKSDLEYHGTPIILYGSLYTNYNLKISKINSFVHEKVGSYKSEGNEIIVPASGETAEDIARASVVAQKGIILGGDLNIICVDKDSFVPEFIALLITYGQPHKYLTKVAQGKSVVHLHNSDISRICLLCPSLEEQQQIVAYFENLDEQISLQTQRLEKLKQIKSACLDKMFV